mgnify:FL=1
MTQDMKNLRPIPWLFATGLRGVLLGLYRPERQAIVDGDGDKRNQADGDDRMHDKREPMPGRCIRAFDGALDENAILVTLADDSGHEA